MNDSYSVSELTSVIQSLLLMDDRLQNVWVQGEVSNCTQAASGHCYFTLKDAGASVRCVMWRSTLARFDKPPRNGDSLMLHGRIDLYAPRGEYQLVADHLLPVGVGDLYMRFEQLKAQLAAEGLFDPDRKRELPPFPLRIGVVTSPEAAAFQDVLNVLRRRFPLAEVVLSPTLVQGVDAPPQIVRAIARLNARDDIDVILVTRGGGSIEDLWAFNDESVARAIAASRIPVVSGVGHETDTTIADFAADLRAPTPSAAAEIMTPDLLELRAGIDRLWINLRDSLSDTMSDLHGNLWMANEKLERVSPARRLGALRQRLDDWNARMTRTQTARLDVLRERLAARAAALSDPRAPLRRGYALVTNADGERVTRAADAPPAMTIHFEDGSVSVERSDADKPARL